METKALPFQLSELKAAGDGWEVAGYASTFGGEPDSYGDVVAKGAFVDSLATRPNVRLLWQHDMGEPIGKALSLVEDERGLFGRWSLVPTDTGRKAHMLLEAGLVDSLSIGFMPKAGGTEIKGDTRVLKAVELVEVSIVTIPANTNAVITAFKADQPLHLLLKQVAQGIDAAVRQAKATHERRTAEGRALNDQSNAALDELLQQAEAALELRALRVVPPDAEAKAAEMELLQMRARLLRARRRTA